jgi:hypothetical protein
MNRTTVTHIQIDNIAAMRNAVWLIYCLLVHSRRRNLQPELTVVANLQTHNHHVVLAVH